MSKSVLSVQQISFNYINQEKSLLSRVTASFPSGWTAVAGPNGSGKSSLLKILAGHILPDSGNIISPGRVLYVDQIPQSVPESLFDLFARSDAAALKLINLLELKYDWPWRWETLSQGEKKRCQIGAAIAAAPEALLLDEPVNHLDRNSRALTASAMAEYKGCGVLVSHNKELLDRFCSRTLFLPEAITFPGGYSSASVEKDRCHLEQRREYEKAINEMKRLKKEAARRRALASTQQSRRSKKNLDRKDSDGRAKLDLVRISGKDGTDGRLLRQMEGRVEQSVRKMDHFNLKKDVSLGVTFRGLELQSDFLWRKTGGFHYYNGVDGLGFQHDDLSISPGERILISGANGAGKSTLLRLIGKDLGEEAWFLHQEITEWQSHCICESFSRLNSKKRGSILSAVRRMGADPEDFLAVHMWSPGEMKKLHIAMALEEEVPYRSLLLLDEPVNHLDLESRSVLEDALSTYPGAIVFVSHEEHFLKEQVRKKMELSKKRGSILLQ